jgi:hypothetical protein
MSGLAAELGIVLASVALYLAYHIWFFCIKGTGLRGVDMTRKPGSLFTRGRIARIQFCEVICDTNDTIAGIQQNRNGLMAVALLTGTTSVLAQKVLSVLLDEDQLNQIRAYGVRVLSEENDARGHTSSLECTTVACGNILHV